MKPQKQLVLGLAAALCAAAVYGSPAVAQSTDTNRTKQGENVEASLTKIIMPSDNLVAELEAMSPSGVTELVLQPGVYLVNDTSIQLNAGTVGNRLRVTAADPAGTLIRGVLGLVDPDFWTFDDLRFQGVNGTIEPVRINGGTDWVIENSEFIGSPNDAFGALTLLNITDDNAGEAPSNFEVKYSCFHHGGTNDPSTVADDAKDHLIYVTSDLPVTSGFISRNIMFFSPNGAAVKNNSSDVKINWNTMQDVAGGVTIQESNQPNLTNVQTARNLVQTVRPLPNGFLHTFWAHSLGAGPPTDWDLIGNYVYSSNAPMYLRRSFTDASAINQVGGANHSTTGNPGFTPSELHNCSGYHPTDPAASLYGRYASGGTSLAYP